MNEMIGRARTIEEKRRSYNGHNDVDYSYSKEWRDVRTLLKDKPFNEMLKENNMTEEEFAYALQPEVDIKKQEGDEWFDTFTEIMDGFKDEMIDTAAGIGLTGIPFTLYLRKKLNEAVKNLKHVKVSEKTIQAFIQSHVTEMFMVFGKLTALRLAIYKEHHKFRARNEKKQFTEFLKNSFGKKEDFISFYESYPVAARVATVRTLFMIKNYTNILEHLDKDHKEVEKFIGSKKLTLTDIKLSTGDSHAQGNSVSILKFDDKKLVYKPKDLRINQAFESFVDWYTKASGMLEVKIPKGIYKETYAYNEFIEKKYCRSEEEVERFYTRYGYLVALCYLFNINDLHLENLIANGEYPVIIDMETLFQVPTKVMEDSATFDMTKRLEVESVAASMLLPRQVHVGTDKDVNMSALNGKGGEASNKILAPKNMDTSNFHYENVKGYFTGGDNIPQYDEEKDVDVSKYSLVIIEAFDQFMQFILENKNAALKELEAFKGKQVRALFKSTERYASMIRYADHPNYNEDMKYRERLMMNIWAYPYVDKRIIKSEVNDLLFNDIPIFFAKTDSKDVIDSHGKIYFHFLDKSGYELARRKLMHLSDKEIRLQKTIMMLSLGIVDPYLNREIGRTGIIQEAKKIDYLAQAKRLADELINKAYVKNNECSFASLDRNDNDHWELHPCNVNLYGGFGGIAVLFLELYRATKDKKYIDFYHMVMGSAIKIAGNSDISSAFSGRLSLIYPMLLEKKYLRRVRDREFLKKVVKILNKLTKEELEEYEHHDYVRGISGIVRILNLLRSYFPGLKLTEDTLDKYIDLLTDEVNKEYASGNSKAGIAHGISGMMYGLVSGGKYDPKEVKKLLDHEFNQEVSPENAFKWNEGYPGMIQARIAMNRIDSRVVNKRQLNTLIKRFETLLNESLGSDALCQGTGGIVTTLKMLYEYTHDEKWMDYLKKWMSDMYMNSLYSGYRVAKVSDIESIGMFEGISGVAWSYLYAALDIDNVLLLEMGE